jgi:MFS family permease
MSDQDPPMRLLAMVGLVVAEAAVLASLVLMGAMVMNGETGFVDTYSVGGLAVGVSYGVMGWLIASRRPDNSIGWVFLLIAISQAGGVLADLAAQYGLDVAPGSIPLAAEWSWVAGWAWAPGFVLLVTFSILLFPDGHPPSPRWRIVGWLAVAVMVLLVVPVAVTSWPYRPIDLDPGREVPAGSALEAGANLQFLGVLLVPVAALASIASMVVRFRRSTGIERQQLKWFTYAAIPEVGFVVVSAFVNFSDVVGLLGGVIFAPLLPIAAGLAILRYRLYEIDRIVSRTISYATVTGILAVVFVVVIVGLQALLADVTSGQTIPVAASTLAVFALFQPLLRRVRRAVDRRFDRARYDAERTAQAFAERLRDEVDLAAVTSDLAMTTRAALAPSTLGVWIRREGSG